MCHLFVGTLLHGSGLGGTAVIFLINTEFIIVVGIGYRIGISYADFRTLLTVSSKASDPVWILCKIHIFQGSVRVADSKGRIFFAVSCIDNICNISGGTVSFLNLSGFHGSTVQLVSITEIDQSPAGICITDVGLDLTCGFVNLVLIHIHISIKLVSSIGEKQLVSAP